MAEELTTNLIELKEEELCELRGGDNGLTRFFKDAGSAYDGDAGKGIQGVIIGGTVAIALGIDYLFYRNGTSLIFSSVSELFWKAYRGIQGCRDYLSKVATLGQYVGDQLYYFGDGISRPGDCGIIALVNDKKDGHTETNREKQEFIEAVRGKGISKGDMTREYFRSMDQGDGRPALSKIVTGNLEMAQNLNKLGELANGDSLLVIKKGHAFKIKKEGANEYLFLDPRIKECYKFDGYNNIGKALSLTDNRFNMGEAYILKADQVNTTQIIDNYKTLQIHNSRTQVIEAIL